MKLTKSYFRDNDVLWLSYNLLGKIIFTNIDSNITAGIITETEAYNGINDKACHAYGGRYTRRTSVMFEAGGVVYIYLCYGIHSLTNIVTGEKDNPQAVLIRYIIPYMGKEIMMQRFRMSKQNEKELDGPGKVSKALGIDFTYSGKSLEGNHIWVEDRGIRINKRDILKSSRIGIDYAEEDKKLPYRFYLHDNAVIELRGIVFE